MTARNTGWRLVLCVPAVLLALLAGCDVLLSQLGPTSTALTGTWELRVASAPELTSFSIDFDRAGEIDWIRYQVEGADEVVDNSPIGVTDVDNEWASIAATFNSNALVFTGTRDEAGTVITGVLTTLLAVNDIVVSVDNEAATLTLVAE